MNNDGPGPVPGGVPIDSVPVAGPIDGATPSARPAGAGGALLRKLPQRPGLVTED